MLQACPQQAHSRPMPRAHAAAWRLVLPLVALLSLPACIFIVTTSPTSVSGATIIFVAVDDGGALVASLHISVVGIEGTWREEGLTASNGAFRCNVGAGVTRVRAGVTLPSGYVLAGHDRWPREIDVPSEGSLKVEIRLRATG
jgi:hypothetical protein